MFNFYLLFFGQNSEKYFERNCFRKSVSSGCISLGRHVCRAKFARITFSSYEISHENARKFSPAFFFEPSLRVSEKRSCKIPAKLPAKFLCTKSKKSPTSFSRRAGNSCLWSLVTETECKIVETCCELSFLCGDLGCDEVYWHCYFSVSLHCEAQQCELHSRAANRGGGVPDVFGVGWGSSAWRGGQKVRYVLRSPRKPNFLTGYPGISAVISQGCPKSLRKKGLCSILVPYFVLFGDFPDFPGISHLVCSIPSFSACYFINSPCEEQSRKGPRHNPDLPPKSGKPPVWKPPFSDHNEVTLRLRVAILLHSVPGWWVNLDIPLHGAYVAQIARLLAQEGCCCRVASSSCSDHVR